PVRVDVTGQIHHVLEIACRTVLATQEAGPFALLERTGDVQFLATHFDGDVLRVHIRQVDVDEVRIVGLLNVDRWRQGGRPSRAGESGDVAEERPDQLAEPVVDVLHLPVRIPAVRGRGGHLSGAAT